MELKKENLKYLYYILVPIIIVVFYQGYNYFIEQKQPDFAVYRPGLIDDCAMTREDVAKQLNFSKLVENNKIELEKTNQDNLKLYESSACISKEMFSFTYSLLDDFSIEHQQGTNSQIYQLSYAKVAELIKNTKKDDDITKQLLKSLDYYLNDAYAKQFLNESELYQRYQPLIGPSAHDESGRYVLVVKVNLVGANVYHDRDHTKLKKRVYFFDSLNLSHEKVGEEHEKTN